MVSNQVIKYAMDDIVFENRNKTYGAYFLRRLYDKNMNRAILIGSVLAILLVSTPMILKALRELMPTDKEDLSLQEIILTDPPPIDPKNPPPPPPPKIDPPPIKDQIKFIPPKVMKDEEVKEEEPPPPTIEEIKDKDISTENRKRRRRWCGRFTCRSTSSSGDGRRKERRGACQICRTNA
ncbi:MAG: hypothetical protein IPN15_22820 [Saprospiraceae bacterium]|nr:hypothetical protein [Candidatus Vicinibacter affinis]